MSADDEVQYEAVFRSRWRDRQTAGARPGELIKQPRWIDALLVALGVLFAAGAVAAATVTIERTASLPALRQGTTIVAVRSGADAPAEGSAVQYRDASGTTVDAIVVGVTPTEVTAQTSQAAPVSAGNLLLPAGRQRIIDVLLPRLG